MDPVTPFQKDAVLLHQSGQPLTLEQRGVIARLTEQAQRRKSFGSPTVVVFLNFLSRTFRRRSTGEAQK